MKSGTRWLYAASAIAAVLIAVSAIVQSVRQGSWSPVLSAGWLAAVIVAVASPRATRRCLQIRRRQR
jgi:antitoxin (DNA-binding transcriptional repressor) of toxin-antitoxin stability system